jgi:predicted NAD/FAD-dependent oxidoreductase
MGVTEIAIVGAGIAGASAAAALARAGYSVVVLEKARGPGGRASTRRGDHAAFDHGAQYFTARDPAFRNALASPPLAAQWARWEGRIGAWDGLEVHPVGDQERLVGVPGMNALARSLLGALPRRYGASVARVERQATTWRLLDAAGMLLARASALILTAPPSQSAALLGDQAPGLRALCEGVRMLPCWALMARYARTLEIDWDGLFMNEGVLSWCARNGSKPGRDGPECWVLHASPVWSADHLECEPAAVAGPLLAAFSAVAGAAAAKPTEVHIHRWRHALADPPLEIGCAWDPGLRIGLAGDWLAGSRIEGAWRSGQELAARIG